MHQHRELLHRAGIAGTGDWGVVGISPGPPCVLAADAVLELMPVQPDWGALRRPLRSCAIGALVLSAFFALWQFLIPGDNSSALVGWAIVLVSSITLAGGIGLPVSASRRLWRLGQRSRAPLPVAFLCVSVIALPMALRELAASATIVFYAVPFALLLSAALSIYLIITAQPVAPVMPSTDLDAPHAPAATNPSDFTADAPQAAAETPASDFNADEPHAYASDISRKRNSG